MNWDICLKFSAFIHHMFVQIWEKKFDKDSISLPATAHFGQNFGRLLRPHLLDFFFEKNFCEVLDLYHLAIGRNFEYLEKNGVFKFFKSLPVHLITTSTTYIPDESRISSVNLERSRHVQFCKTCLKPAPKQSRSFLTFCFHYFVVT